MKYKNINTPYALVNNRVFGSIPEAIKFCEDNGIGEENIKTEDPEVLEECKRIARATLPLLEALKDKLQELFKLHIEETRKFYNEYDKRKVKEVGAGVYRDWGLMESGKVTGVYEAMVEVDAQIMLFHNILCLK